MSLNVRVITPDKVVWDAMAEELILPSSTGQIGILTDHAPLLTALDIGVMRLKTDAGWTSIVLMEGFAEVEENKVTILCNGAEEGSSIDRQTAQEELEKVTALVDEATTKSIEQQRKQSKFDRQERLKDTLQTTATNFATIPFYTRLLEDAAKRRLELDKAMLGAREMMPSNIQNIMLSKQAQQQMASSAFAEEAKALATQQDAATRFAGLGMQRPFGQA